MINFTCGGCEKKYSVPEEYSGKKARCKQCSHTNTIPSNDPVESPEPLIAFTCDQCGKNIRVKQEHAGKRVRCPGCAEVCTIPLPVSSEPKPAEEPEFEEEQWEDDSSEGFEYSDDLSALAADAANAPESQIKISDRAVPKAAPRAKRSSGGEGGFMAFAKGAGKVPLSLGASVVFTVAGAIAWMILAKIFSGGVETEKFYGLNFLAIPVATLAGFGLVVLTGRRNILFGFLAVIIGFCGIICGKVLIAKYVIQPKFSYLMSSDPTGFMELDTEYFKELAGQDFWVFAAQCYSMKDRGEIEQDLILPVIMVYAQDGAEGSYEQTGDDTSQMLSNIAGEMDISAERQEQIDQVKEKALGNMENLTSAQREQLTVDYGPDMYKDVMSFLADSTPFNAVMSFIASFALLDLLFIPMGLWGAFKAGIGKK